MAESGKTTEDKKAGNRKNAGKDRSDLVQKDFEAYPDVSADIINALLYRGKRKVAEQNLVPAPTETVYQGSERLRNQYEDLAKYEMLAGELNMIYLFANQSAVDYRILLRKASYTGAVYGEQYERKIPTVCPVAEMVLYWGEKRWNSARSMRKRFRGKKLPREAWEYIDDLKLHVWEMRYLPPEVREQFTSDMRIVVDYLAEGNGYRSDRPVRHKEALIKMIRVLSGETDIDDTAEILREMNIREEDEIKVCELFDQYTRLGRKEGLQQGFSQGISQGLSQGLSQGIKALIVNCKDLKVSFAETTERVKASFQLSDAEVQSNMRLYWEE